MSKTVQYSALGAVLLVGIGYFAFRSARKDTDDRPPDTAASVTHWVCDKCGTHVELTARAQARWETDSTHVDRRGGASHVLRFKCDKCGTYTLCRAKQCPEHKTWFVLVDSNDQVGVCPECAKKAGS